MSSPSFFFTGSAVFCVAFLSLLLANGGSVVEGHGMMIDPPQRSSMHDHGFPSAPRNPNANSLNCGGAQIQQANGGRCGECGDNWTDVRPRNNDEGGKYFAGLIAGNYTRGSLIPVVIQLTAAHNGYYEFHLCTEKKTINELVTQQCLDKNLLTLVDGTTRAYRATKEGIYTILVQLPMDVTCQFCVIQWRYVTDNGTKEEFINCADVAIF